MTKNKKHNAARQMMRDSVRGFEGWIGLILFSRIAANVLYIAYVLCQRELIDRAVSGDPASLLSPAMALCAVVCVQIVLSYAQKWLDSSVQNRAALRVRTRMYTALMNKKQGAVSAFHSAVLTERLTKDLTEMLFYPITLLPGFIGTLAGLVLALVTMFSLSALLPSAILCAGLLLCAVGRLVQTRTKHNYSRFREEKEQMNAYYQESFQNLLMFKVFRAQRQAGERAMQYEKSAYGAWKHWYLFNQILKSGMGTFFQAGYLGAMIFCAYQIGQGSLSFGSMTAILQLVGAIQDPISALGDVFSSRFVALTSADRLLELMNLPDEKKDENIDCRALYDNMARMEIKNVNFSYDTKAVLHNASACMHKGDFVVLSGTSGAGKSTLLRLMLGVYEDYDGTIEWVGQDNTRRTLDASTRGLFAYVPQSLLAFSGTIRENLQFLCGQATDDEIWQAVRLADAEDFILHLPRGLDEMLGERGRGLSEGQSQRLAIARALLTHAPILMLDEATSALDEATEKRVLENIRSIPDISLIIISHRRAAFDICGVNWCMKNGGLEERTENDA